MRRLSLISIVGLSPLLHLACTTTPCPTVTPDEQVEPRVDPAAEAKKLNTLLEAFFEDSLAFNPVRATMIGDKRYNYLAMNFFSPTFRVAAKAFDERWRDRVRAEVDRSTLTGQDALSYDIFIDQRERDIAGHRFPDHLQPINQFFSIPSMMAMMGSGRSFQPFETVKDYEDWLFRLDSALGNLHQSIINMREGMARGVTQPRVVMQKVLPQLATHLVDDIDKSIFMAPTKAFPDGIGEDDRRRLTKAYRDLVEHQVLPAFGTLHDFIRDEYLPEARETVGYWALPEGEAWYRSKIRHSTTTDMPPDEIHALGLREVERIQGEMRKVMKTLEFDGDLAAFFKHLREDESLYYQTEAEVLDAYRALQKKINALLPTLFDVLPKADYEVRPIEAFRAKSMAAAQYMPATPDGSRPGVFYVNTHDLKVQPKWGFETLSIHEASPGHHFQVSIQQEVETLPRFRRFGGYTAYVEGWALYAESLGKELGVFTDPYQYYGHLEADLMRAMRLVVDTGLHHKRWTREQAIAYMTDNSAMTEADVVAEVERYVVIPGQALAYKIGQMRIRALRDEAETALGERFDVKAFHRQILIDGALPLDVLSAKIRLWISAQKG